MHAKETCDTLKLMKEQGILKCGNTYFFKQFKFLKTSKI